MAELRLLPIGTCLVNQPAGDLRGRVLNSLQEFRYGGVQLLTIPEAVQFVEFLRGRLTIPRPLWTLCGLNAELPPSQATRDLLDTSDFVFLEPNTPIRLHFREFYLMRVILSVELFRPLADLGEEAAKAVRAWHNQGIMRGSEEVRRSSAQFLSSLVTGNDEASELKRQIILETRPSVMDREMTRQSMERFAEVMARPVGIVTYTHLYLPDGRPLPWPANFVEDVVAAAEALGLPYMEPSKMVQEHGVAKAMKADRAHYTPEFQAIIADALYQFALRSLAARPAMAEAASS